MNEPPARDFFDKARAWAVALMLAGGVAGIVGSTLEWASITERPRLQEGTSFEGEENRPEEPVVTQPFTGLEARDGWWTLGGGCALVVFALLLWWRKRSRWGWLGILVSIVIGAVAIADYRGIGNLSSSISRRMDIVGGADPAVGLTLVVGAAFAGLIGSAAGIAASPRAEAIRTSA